ncbi:MAG: polysaccharide deacetylase family protein, partial [Verrucomicrobiae bacterium]|nr:polysaccharide deacetylase family protein [Verrucomicrobiae bacterium]
MIRRFLAASLPLLLLHAHLACAQDEAFALPTDDPTIPDDGVRVSVLGYHDFSPNLPETAMRISTEKFRQQMQTIRQLGIPVISMADFIAWKNGERDIPQKAILITIDDGWKTVYEEAYPVLKEFGYPFTVYLYKQYVDGGGKAL